MIVGENIFVLTQMSCALLTVGFILAFTLSLVRFKELGFDFIPSFVVALLWGIAGASIVFLVLLLWSLIPFLVIAIIFLIILSIVIWLTYDLIWMSIYNIVTRLLNS